jgi:cation diffusion facilitator CzcD-associated flavoprotein CzcO
MSMADGAVQSAPTHSKRSQTQPVHLPIVIIGSGFGGIGLAIKLREAGIDDFTILERAMGLGGTWRDNTYPGCACDVASNLYSFSFAQNPEWSRIYSPQAEILEYLRAVARDHDIERSIRYGHELLEAHWDEQHRRWQLKASAGEFSADIVVTAVGALGEPVVPKLPGIERYKGKAFHTFHWDHQHDLTGKKVAVIGTGASAVQVVPAIQPQVEKLSVFQRTPIWIIPRMDGETSKLTRTLLRRVPLLQRAIRAGWFASVESFIGLPQFVDDRFFAMLEALGRWQLRRQVKDSALREKLKPNYRFFCKRPALSDEFYPALTQPNVDVITSGIKEVTAHGIVTEDGVEHEIDTLIYATGFRVPHQISERILGRDGRTMSEKFGKAPAAYLGSTVTGYPNLFMMMGPYAGPGSQSFIYMLEAQAQYITDAVRTMRRKQLAVVDTRPEVFESFKTEMNERSRKTTWLTGGCKSYYQNAEGGNAGLWPHWSFMFRWRTRRFDLRKFETQAKEVTA